MLNALGGEIVHPDASQEHYSTVHCAHKKLHFTFILIQINHEKSTSDMMTDIDKYCLSHDKESVGYLSYFVKQTSYKIIYIILESNN